MKELSIEEKAKAYDEALEQARKELKTCGSLNCDTARQIFRFFPELTENEDEKIRKFLIKCVQQPIGTNLLNGIKKDDVIVWLEKQKGCIYTADDIITAEDHAFLAGADWQKEQNKKLEKRGEQKPADEVESKFKTNDIITNGKTIGKIDENENNKYHGWFGYNKDLSVHYADIPDIENWHLWTIQDAKDGDVLYENDNNTVLIFKSQTCGWIKVYCDFWINKNKFTGTDHADYGKVSEMELKPATKEQRDLLFQKMKEAGYEWDAEKKELKKIEKNYTWSKDDEQIRKELIQFLIDYPNLPNGKYCIADFFNWLEKQGEQNNLAWSEADEKQARQIKRIVHDAGCAQKLQEQIADWLKSIKKQMKGE